MIMRVMRMMMNWKLAVGLIALAGETVCSDCPPLTGPKFDFYDIAPTPAELQKIKARFTIHVTDNSSETSASAIAWAKAVNANGSWSDINYEDETRGAWSAMGHMERCAAMAQALAAHSEVLDPLVRAVGFWLEHDFRNQNWWYAVIGVPVEFTTVMLLLDNTGHRNALTQTQQETVLKLMERSGYSDSTKWTGANLADVMKVQVARGILFNNGTAVALGFARLWKELFVSHWCDDNIQADGSFHQHSDEGVRGALLAGSYGTVFTTDMLGAIDLAYNTSMAVSGVSASVMASLVLDGQRWMITQHNEWDWSVVGRHNSMPGSFDVDDFGMNGQYLPELDAPERSAELKQFAACLAGEKGSCQHLIGNRHFWDSDYHVHRREDWMVTVRMYSNRTIAARCVNAQGKKNSHEADGVTNLYISSNSIYPYEDIFPVWNFHEVAGMSSEINMPLLSCNGADAYSEWPLEMNYTDWVGGISNGNCGAAAMNLSSGTLHALNTWTFGNFGYVHSGTGLKCSSDSPVTTSLANRLLNNGRIVHGQSYPFHETDLSPGNHTFPAVSGWWAWLEEPAGSSVGTLYVLDSVPDISGAVISVSNSNRTGDWSALGTAHGKITRSTFQLLVEYVVPVIPHDKISKVLLSPSWEVLINTEEIQYIRWMDGSNVSNQATFWAAQHKKMITEVAQSLLILGCSAPAMVMTASDGTTLSITVSSPVVSGALNVTLQGLFHGSNCTADDSIGETIVELMLPVGDYQGKSVSVTCQE